MNQINPQQSQQRTVLRIIGPTVLGVGAILAIVGLVSFFSGFGSAPGDEDFGKGPEYFWCAFVGLPMIAVGLMICQFAYMGKIFRYVAGETAPVGKDTFNYLAKGTKEGVKDVTSAIREGLAGEDADDGDGENIEERIRELEGLRDRGVITSEDFEEQKDRILDDLRPPDRPLAYFPSSFSMAALTSSGRVPMGPLSPL